jgi:hypothetical protein
VSRVVIMAGLAACRRPVTRCPERNIRADALDEFVLDQLNKHCCSRTCCSPGNTPSPSPHGSSTTDCSLPNSPGWTQS